MAAIFFGAAGLASVTTLTSAMIAKADRRGLCFFCFVYSITRAAVTIILTSVTKSALIEGATPDAINDLSGFSGVLRRYNNHRSFTF